jgi:transglutaminase/protease-like cytokinesis protein 3
MKQFLLLFFILSSLVANSQDFLAISETISKYPKFTTPEKLANQIASDFKNDETKAKATFLWISKNISYDLDQFYNPKQQTISFRYSNEEERLQKLQEIKNDIVKNAFLTRSGVCEEYAQSFKKICDLLGLESEVIKGYVRNSANEIGKIPTSPNHAWNALKINNKWLILDATWAAGFEQNGKWVRKFDSYFYDMPMNKIFQTHFPDEKIWQLRIGRMSIDTFYNQPIYNNTFLNSKTTLVSPKRGIITSNVDIIIKLSTRVAKAQIHYMFQGSRYSKSPTISSSNSKITLTIPNPKRNTELYIFIDRELALQYKVKKN